MIIERLVDDFMADSSGLSPRTLVTYSWALGYFARFFPGRHVRSIKADELSRWLGSLRLLALGSASVHSCFRVARSFLRWCLRRGWLISYPLATVKAPRLLKPAREGLALDQLRSVLRACDGGSCPVRDRLIVLVLLDTGLRLAELVALQAGDVDTERHLVVVRLGKGGKGRIVPVSAVTAHQLAAWLAGRDRAVSLFGLGRPGVVMLLRRLSLRSGVKFSAHVLRHSFASLYDGDIEDLRVLLGHSDISTTSAIYRHRLPARLVGVHDARSPVGKL